MNPPGLLRRDHRGQTIVEFAAVVPIALLLVFAIFEFGAFFYTKITVRHSVLEATRFAVTGASLEDADGEPIPRADAIKSLILARAQNIQVDVDAIEIDPPDGGGPEEVVRVSVSYRYTFTVPLLQRLMTVDFLDFTVSTAMRNEPFPR